MAYNEPTSKGIIMKKAILDVTSGVAQLTILIFAPDKFF